MLIVIPYFIEHVKKKNKKNSKLRIKNHLNANSVDISRFIQGNTFILILTVGIDKYINIKYKNISVFCQTKAMNIKNVGNMRKKFVDARYSINMEEAGKRLKTFRIARHLTLADLSEQTGLSIGMLSETESGRNKPSPNLMLALYRIYGLNINWLLSGEGEPEVKKTSARPPRNEKGELVYDMEALLWLMEKVPVVKFSVLGFFSSYYFENRKTIEKFLKETEEKNSDPPDKGEKE